MNVYSLEVSKRWHESSGVHDFLSFWSFAILIKLALQLYIDTLISTT